MTLPHAAFSRDESDYNRRTDWYDSWKDSDARQLQGRWYVNGDPKKLAEINADSGNLQARNENGQTSRLEVDRTGNVRAPDWRLRGDLRGNRIEWANGTQTRNLSA